jgi:transposase
MHRELRRAGVTLALLWEEHRSTHPDGYDYSRFCELYRGWEARLSPTMRQPHVAGERMFVDYAGTSLEVIDATTGEVRVLSVVRRGARRLQLLLCRSDLQRLVDWIGSHVRAFAFFGGVTAWSRASQCAPWRRMPLKRILRRRRLRRGGREGRTCLTCEGVP